MSALLLVSDDEKQISLFLQKYQEKNRITSHALFSLRPLGKEISIDQIREIKRNIIFYFSQTQLFVLFDFDTASYEAQNAFLKTLEEHSESVQFILIVKNYHALLPTIVSRTKLVFLPSTRKLQLDKTVTLQLNPLVESQDLALLADRQFQKNLSDNSDSIFDQMLFFFKKRLSFDKKATSVLRKLLEIRSAIQRNNVNTQNGIDHLLIYMRNQYRND